MLESLIGLVQVYTLDGIANFYIINILTQLLFYLKDTNILNIYLNNITN